MSFLHFLKKLILHFNVQMNIMTVLKRKRTDLILKIRHWRSESDLVSGTPEEM